MTPSTLIYVVGGSAAGPKSGRVSFSGLFGGAGRTSAGAACAGILAPEGSRTGVAGAPSTALCALLGHASQRRKCGDYTVVIATPTLELCDSLQQEISWEMINNALASGGRAVATTLLLAADVIQPTRVSAFR